MGNNVKKRFTVSLDLETKDLEKQFVGIGKNIKTILADLGSASDKMGYFKDLVGYIGQIDSALVAMQAKNKDAFDHMFDGLDANLKKEFEQIFGVAEDQLVVLDQLKDKLKALKGSGTATGADLKPLEQEVKSLYESLGMLDKLDMSGKGKIETRIKKLEAALENFATVFGDVNAKISQGLNFGSAHGGKDNTIPDMVQDANKQVDQLKQMKNTVKKAVNDFYKELTKISGASQSKLDSIKETLQQDLGLKDEEFFDLNDIFYDLEDAEIEVDEAIKQISDIVTKFHKAKQAAAQTMQSGDADSSGAVQHNLADAIQQEANDAVSAIDYGKKQLVKAWQDYYKAVQKAKNKGMDVVSGAKSHQMADMEASIEQMLNDFGIKASKPSKWGITTDLDLSEYIIDGDIGFDEIEDEINKLFNQYDVSFDAPIEEMQAKMSNAAAESSQEVVAAMDKVETKTSGVLSSFQQLVNYISQSGQKPANLFDKLESGAKSADEELKSILQSLNLIDSAGNINFNSINSGYTNKGGFVSDQYTMIARKITGDLGQDYWGKSQELQGKLAAAQKAGAQVGAIFDLIKDEANGLFYEIQNTVSGTAAFSVDDGSVNMDVLNASNEQLSNLVHTMQALSDNGLFIDFGGSNILYDKNKGFSIIDLGLVGGHGHTVSKQNTLQENIDRFVQEYLKFAPSNLGPDFQHGIADVMYEIASGIDPSVVNPSGGGKKTQVDTKNVVSGVKAEEAAHKENTEAINAEAAALEALIQLKEKAQNMKWKEFAKDSSLDDLKKTAGFTSVSQLEKFWKQARYDKQINYHEISKHEAVQIFDDKLTPGLADKWYGPQQFMVKDQLENEILQDDEIRNAALNYLYYLYENHLPKEYKNPDVKNFQDFLETEFEVFRGDDAPLIYGDESKLSFTFNPNATSGFDSQTGTAKMKPKNTIGNAGSTFYSEVEVFGIPASDTSWFKKTDESFLDYYNKQSKEMQDEIDVGLINLEKQRVQDLLDSNVSKLAHKAGKDIDFQNGILQQFKQGIVPESLDAAGDGSLADQFAAAYNGLSDIDKKLVAYYATLESISASLPPQFSIGYGKESSKDIVGKDAKLFNAVLNDPTGVQNYVSKLTGESKFGILGRNAKNIDLEANMHKINTKAIKEETQAQQELNQVKAKSIDEKFVDADAELHESYNAAEINSDHEDAADKLWDEIIAVQKTFDKDPSMILNGEYVGHDKQVAQYSDLVSKISDYENTYGENLSKVWNYISSMFDHHIKAMNDLVVDITDDSDDLIIEDFDAYDPVEAKEKYDKAYSQIWNKFVSTSNVSEEDDALEIKHFIEQLQVKMNALHGDGSENLNLGELIDDEGVIFDEQAQYQELSKLVLDYENKYNEKLDHVWDYIKAVFNKASANALDMSDDLILEIDDDDILIEESDVASTTDDLKDKFHKAFSKLSDIINAVYDGTLIDMDEHMSDLYDIKSHIDWINIDTDINKDVISGGQYKDPGDNLLDPNDLNALVTELENKTALDLSTVHSYLESVFAGYIKQIDDVVEITLAEDDELEFNADDYQVKFHNAIQQLSDAMNNAMDPVDQFSELLKIKNHINWIDSDSEYEKDVIAGGKYLDTDNNLMDPMELSDWISDYESKYSENLSQVHEYLQHVFKKQFDEIDALFSGQATTLSTPDANINKETANLNELATEVNAVEQAVQNKTNAFEQEGAVVSQVVDKEITALSELRVLLDDIQNYLQTIFGNNSYNLGNLDLSQDKINGDVTSNVLQSIQQTLGQILTVLQGFTGIKSDNENSLTYQEPAVDNTSTGMSDDLANKLVGDIATETTLAAVRVAVEQLSKSIKTNDDDSDLNKNLSALVTSLSDSVTVLKDAANGIVQHQKAQKSDTSVAMAKIQDPAQNHMMSGIAKDAVKSLGLEAEVESLQALADGVVKIEGAFKNANGIWEGFTVKINEHNQAVDLAVKKHSAFAKMLNSSKADEDDNPHVYDKAEVEARAQKHLEEYAAQGKKATVQFKDSGRYTITILEEIDGLTKQIFQTFDENDDKIERTTVTMSNNQKAKLDSLQKKLIDNGLANGLISDKDAEYKAYQDASEELNKMTDLYSQLDNLSDVEIAKWKQQIALVQQLGNQLEGLVKQRKLENDQKVFESDKGKKLSKFDLDHATLQKDIAIPDSFTSRISDARSAIENATDADSLKIAINNWEALQNEIKKTAVEQDLYFKKTKQPSTSTAPDQFTKDFNAQKKAFEKYKNDAVSAVGVTDDLRDRLNKLETDLSSISDANGLDTWVQAFNTLQTDILNAQNKFKIGKQAIATEISAKANSKFKETGFKKDDNNLTQEQQDIVDKYNELSKQIKEYNKQVNNGQDAEISGILATRDALYQLIDAYKQKNNISENTYGAKQLTNFGVKYNSLMAGAADVGLTSQNAAVKNLEDAYQRLQAAQAAFNASDNLKSEEGKKKVQAFLAAKQACNEYARELKKLVDAEKQLMSGDGLFEPLESDFDDTAPGRREALVNFMQSTYGASAAVNKFNDDCNELSFIVRNGDGTLTDMTATINAARTAIYATAGATKEVSTGFGVFVNSVVSKFKSIIPYLTASFGWQEIWQQVRQGIQYVREIDGALTELKKVTNETDAAYDRFLQSMSKTAGVVGSTVSELTTMSADWAKLGYSMQEAGKLAESTAILLNVSEFQDANAASEALISTMQAFQYTANESQHVVDILNEVGNNYAVSSDGIAIALQDSASALMEAGNNLEQSVALVAAANKVVQDPNSVGSALRTISLRLRGTSVEVLEELGEETDGAAESISKMQAKLKALTGVDILTDSGAYKDTYTILKEIAEVWESMDPMDQAAALELMAGKNRANTLAAILNNMEDLEGAYESALNAEGSAMRENEAYLDSIQGRIDLFNNALQTFWMNLLNTDVIKGIVDAGTTLLKFADTFIGKMTIVAASLLIFEKFKSKKTFAEMFTGIIDNAQKAYSSIKSVAIATGSLTKADIARSLASKGVENSLVRRIIAEAGLKGVTGALTKEQIKATAATLSAKFATGDLTVSQYLATMSTMGLKTALQALGNVLKANPVYAIAAAVAVAALALDALTTTAQEAADAAKESFDEIQNIINATKSNIQSLESELSTIQDQIDALEGKQLSFADEKELDRLKAQREELEHSKKVQEQLLELQQQANSKQAVATMKAYTKAASEGAEETQKSWKSWLTGIGAALGITGGVLLTPFTGGTSLGVAGAAAATLGLGAAGGFFGNKAGELAGSKVTENDGTYDSWYETYTKALDTARENEQEALKKYQKDSSNIDKLNKWQDAQQKTSEIETEMYEHLSQMQQYYAGLEYSDTDEELNKELDAWYNFLDKLSIEQGASGAEVTALDRIFGETASEDIQAIEDQIIEAIKNGEEFDFEKAVGSSQELKDTLEYIGLDTEDVKDYFTQIGEEAKKAQEATSILSDLAKTLDSIQSKYDTLQGAIDEFNERGAISGETLKSLIDNNLLQYLTFTENGLIADANAMQMLEQAAINEAYAMLNAAMVQDMENYALGKTEQLSALAQNAIGLVGNAAADAGAQAAQGAQGFLSFASAVAQAGIIDPGNLTAGLQQIYNAYQNIGNAIGHTSAYRPSDAYKSAAGIGDKGGSSSNSAKEIDWIEHYYTEIENRIDELNARLENKISNVQALDAKNTIIDQIVDLYDQKQQKLANAVATYDARADYLFSTFSSDIQNKINNGSLDISSITDENLASNIEEYYGYIEAASQARVEAEELKQTIADLAKQKFDNISTAYENEIGLVDAYIDALQDQIDATEARGEQVGASYYEGMIDSAEKRKQSLEEERNALQASLDEAVKLGQVEVGSDTWYEMVNAIYDLDSAIVEAENSMEEWQTAINDLHWENFDKLISKLDGIASELDNIYERLTDNDEAFDENGDWTNQGIAALGMLTQKMEQAQFAAQQYAEQIDQLSTDYAAGKYSEEEYNEKLAELTEGQWESIEAYEAAKDEIVDLNKARVDAVKDGMQKELDAYKELIDAKKESLEADKEAHDWAKQIAEKEQNIADIQRKLAALTSDNSTSANAQKKKLQAELLKAQEELDEAYYDKSIEDQQDALDKEYENYEENQQKEIDSLEEWLDNREAIIQDSFDLVKENTQVIYDELLNLSQEYGVQISDEIIAPWQSGKDAIGEYKDAFTDPELNAATSEFMNQLDSMKSKWEETASAAEDAAQRQIDAINAQKEATIAAQNEIQANTPTATDVGSMGNVGYDDSDSSGGSAGWGSGTEKTTPVEEIEIPELEEEIIEPEIQEELDEIQSIFDNIKEKAPEVAEKLMQEFSKFFNETLPNAWNAFWEKVGVKFTELGVEAEKLGSIIGIFFTETVPEKWNEFWNKVGIKFEELCADAQKLGEAASIFFTQTIPEKWNAFWTEVGQILTQDIPYAIGYATGVVYGFFSVTLPEAWAEFWDSVDTFLNETLPVAYEELKNKLNAFWNEVIVSGWHEFWDNVDTFLNETLPSYLEELKNELNTFWNETIVANWHEFWDNVSIFLHETLPTMAEEILNSINTFWNETIVGGWYDFWDSVDVFINETIPNALAELDNRIRTFWNETVVEGWHEFWDKVDMAFFTPIQTAFITICNDISTFFSGIPGYISGMWNDVTRWISEQASAVWDNLVSGFTAGFNFIAGGSSANGTANANGTAYADGSWGAPKTETSLVGELGPEILVRNGKWTTVGENGAEFTQVKKGDIIFNHKQSEQLLKNGHVTGRGKAYASGTWKSLPNYLDDLGEELTMCIGQNGGLQFLSKGAETIATGAIGSLTNLAQFDTTDILNRSRPSIGASPSVVNNTMEVKIDASVGELIHVDHLDGNNLDEIGKFVDKAWEKKMQTLNNSIKKFTR